MTLPVTCSKCQGFISRPRLSGLCDSCLRSGLKRRDEALERVEQGAPVDWKAAAKQAVENVASRMSEFIPDDVWDELAKMGWTERPREARALGPVMVGAARRGLIENSGRVRQTAQPQRHAAPVTIWLSRTAAP